MINGGGQEWLRPEVLTEPAPGGADRVAMYELRPLSLGEILDRIFALYRSRFLLFAGISAVSASVHIVVQALSLSTSHALLRSLPAHPFTPQGAALIFAPRQGAPPIFPLHTFVAAQLSTYIAGLAYFLVAALTQAATSLALSQVYLQQATGAKEALRAVSRRWARWIGIALWQAWSLVYLPLLVMLPALVLLGYGSRSGATAMTGLGVVLACVAILGGVPVGVVLYLRNALAIPAAVLEQLPVRPAMRRSKALSVGTRGRLFVVLLIAGCLLGVEGALQSPMTFLILLSPHQDHYVAQAISLLIAFVGRTVVAPVAMIGLTLVYFDQRVRKEALDLQLLLDGRQSAPAPAAGMVPLV